MANKSGGPSKVGQALNYKNSKRWSSNRSRRLTKLALLNPNNLQLQKALDNEFKYRRRIPTVRFWSKSKIRAAEIIKKFKGSVSLDIFNKNEKVSAQALMLKGPYSSFKYEPANEKLMFQLGARVHTKGLQWR